MKKLSLFKITATIILLVSVLTSCSQEFVVVVTSGTGGTATATIFGEGNPVKTLNAIPGDTIILSAVPNDRYVFGEWIYDDTTGLQVVSGLKVVSVRNHVAFVMPKRNITINAEFRDPQPYYYDDWFRFNNTQGIKHNIRIKPDTISTVVTNISGNSLSYVFYCANLTWEMVPNTEGDHVADFPMGYKVIGTVYAKTPSLSINVARLDGSTTNNPKVGETVVQWFYIHQDDKNLLMTGNPNSSAHEAMYGPYMNLNGLLRIIHKE